ncbi:MAG TPA: acetyltransferase [Thermoanaerobaculia bacterium]|jgi:sugar O-acyltransferase (sialic acid O-acetyltransferase NeuD family)
MAKKPLLVVGDGEFAQIVHEYLTTDSDYDVAAFAVERAFLKRESLLGLPVIALEDAPRLFPPSAYEACVAVTYTQLNRVRARLYAAVKAMGYRLARYVSSKSSVAPTATIGENTFLFEFNVIQYQAVIGDDVMMWTFNHVGHRGAVGSHSFVTSHVVVAGFSSVGESCFLGTGAIVGDNVTVGRDTIIGAGAVALRDVPDRQVMRGNPAVHAGVDSFRIFGVRE